MRHQNLNTERPVTSLSTTEAAVALGVSKSIIDRLCREGDLYCFRIPGSHMRRIYLRDLREFAKRHGMIIDEEYVALRLGFTRDGY